MANEIVKICDLSPLLTNDEKAIVIASRETKIKHLKDVELANKVSELISVTIVVLGHSNKEIDNRVVLEAKIVKDIQTSFSNLTLKEIERAFYLGARGAFKNSPDEGLYISVSNIYTWLVKYQIDVRREAMKKQIEFYNKQEKDNAEQKILEALTLNIKGVKEEYEKFLNGYPIYDPLNVLYDFLDGQGLIRLSIARKKEIFEKVKEKYKSDHLKSNSKHDHNNNKKVLREIEQDTDKVKSIYKMLAKQEALKITFNDIKESGMTIDDYLA